MNIVVDYNDKDNDVIKIESAKHIGDYLIKIFFNDGKEKTIDFKEFLHKSLNPSIIKYRNNNLFSNFQIIDGNLNWNDYDMIFPIWDLYSGKLE